MHYGVENWGKIGEEESDRHQNLINVLLYLGDASSLQKISSKPIHDFLRFLHTRTDHHENNLLSGVKNAHTDFNQQGD